MPFPKASRALERFTVLDLTRVRSGPTCVRQLADWGANVIKIELPPEPGGGEPLGGPREGSDFQNLHRNKRSMTLNLKTPEAVAANERSYTGQYLRETLAKAPVSSESVAVPKPRKRAKRASEDQPDLIAVK
jgi:hypothetical protein